MARAFFDPLLGKLAANPDVILGEMDIENDVMAIAVSFDESGILLYDVSNPAKPVFKDWERHSKCEELAIDVDCGAYVDVSEDGQVAFLSLQDISAVPQDPAPGPPLVVTEPGVAVFDISDLENPILTQMYTTASGVGGTHTSTSHVIPDTNPVNPNETGSRDGGEYLFSVANSVGVHISEVVRPGGVPQLVARTTIQLDEAHDTFMHNDPLTGRTYLYTAAGFSSGFYVHDVTNPSAPELIAEWDLTPECGEDWYGHTVDTVIRNGRRYVTIDAETFRTEGFGEQDEADQQEGCGKYVGNGDRPGPLWIVDATDFSKLHAEGDDAEDGEEQGQEAQDLKARSRAALVTTWVNPARRAAGGIEFSPHNQQVVGNRIYLSNYHGGVYMLNATKAFKGIRGSAGRPTELAFVVPHSKPIRPFHDHPVTNPLLIPFIVEFFDTRPSVWDTRFYKGCVLIPDSTGGLYSYAMGGVACGKTNTGGGDNGDDDRRDD